MEFYELKPEMKGFMPHCAATCPQFAEGQCKVTAAPTAVGNVCEPSVRRMYWRMERGRLADVDWSKLSMKDLTGGKPDVMWWMRETLSQAAIDKIVLAVFERDFHAAQRASDKIVLDAFRQDLGVAP